MKQILLFLLLSSVLFLGQCAEEEVAKNYVTACPQYRSEIVLKEAKKQAEKGKLDKMLAEADHYKRLADRYHTARNNNKAKRFGKLYNMSKASYDREKAAYDKKYLI